MTEPPKPRAVRDELVLKAYSLWLVDPGRAIAPFRDQERRRAWMEEEWRDDILWIDSPRFASYAALLRGVLHERGYAEWCRWVADRLEGDVSEAGG